MLEKPHKKITAKRTLLLKEIGKDIPLLSFTQDCNECSGKMCPCQVALTRAHTKMCILSLTYVPPHSMVMPLQGALKAVFLSHVSFTCFSVLQLPLPLYLRVCCYFFHLSTNFLRLPCLTLSYLLQYSKNK